LESAWLTIFLGGGTDFTENTEKEYLLKKAKNLSFFNANVANKCTNFANIFWAICIIRLFAEFALGFLFFASENETSW